MTVDLLHLQPIKISTDLGSYSSLIYGEPKIGKTTFVEDLYGARVLHVMTEKRYKGLVKHNNVQYIHNWSDFLAVLKQLKFKQVKEQFDVVSIDTVENLYTYLEKYVAAKYNESHVGERNDIWGADWTDLKNSWKDSLMKIEQLDYVPCFVSHSIQETVRIPKSAMMQTDKDTLTDYKEVKKDGKQYVEFLRYQPDLKDKVLAPINKMVDNILFLTMTTDAQGNEYRVIHTRESLQWQAGSTFKNIATTIPLDADAYKKEVLKAIGSYEKEEKTDKRQADFDEKEEELDFDALMAEAKKIAQAFHKEGKMEFITAIVDEEFGLGQKLTQATPKQVEVLKTAVERFKETAKEQGVNIDE